MSGEYGHLVLANALAYQAGRHLLFGLILFYGRVTFHQGIMERHPLLKGVKHGREHKR